MAPPLDNPELREGTEPASLPEMRPERWAQVKCIFDRVVELEASQRLEHLDRACGDDRALRQEVESLLDADGQADSVLDAPLSQALGDLFQPATAVGQSFGPYRVTGEIGRGGMAVVFAAQRADAQFDKAVAVKLIKRGMDTDAVIARFRRERQILANLEHPNIARLVDGGVSDDGLPYLVMELVDGEPIDAYCRGQRLTVSQRLDLFRTVCSAVHTAHQNLVVHRDLKPSNILVTAEGIPKLLDFGIAKLLDVSADGTAGGAAPAGQPTALGLRPMTPKYASPEQVRGQAVTTASDVYSLGILLYELLTGQRPFELEGLSTREIEDAVCEQPPARPSTCQGLSKRLRRRLRGDLDTIVLMALEKEPRRRYHSAEQLSEDIRRHLQGLPVAARRHTVLYRASTFVSRHRWGVLAVGLLFLSLVGGLASTIWQARVAQDERGRAEWVSNFMVDLFTISHPSQARGESITARQVLDRGAERIRRNPDTAPQIRAELLRSIGLAYAKLGLFEKAEPLLKEAVDMRHRDADSHPLALMAALNDLGELLTDLARYPGAEALHRQALTGRQQYLPADDQAIVESLNSLALALYHQHRHDEAESLLRRALALQSDDALADPLLNSTRNNLALVMKAQGQLAEAESLYRLALASNRRYLGEDHPDVALNLNNLAEILRAEDRCEQAIELYQAALDLEERLLGDDHVDIAGTRNNLAGCLKDLQRWDEAEALYLSALEIRRRALGEEHPAVAATLNNLAEVYYGRRDLARTETLYRQALALTRHLYGETHPDVARILGNLATVLADQGDVEAAEALYHQALGLHRQLDGEKTLAMATQRHNLARLLLRAKRPAEAEPYFRAAFEVRQLHLDAEHRDVAQSLFGLAIAAGLAGPPERAEPALRQALELWQRWPQEGRVQIAGLQSLLGGGLVTRGALEEAETMLLESEVARPDPRTRQRLVELYELRGQPVLAARFRGPPP